jgi:hypothetical protein
MNGFTSGSSHGFTVRHPERDGASLSDWMRWNDVAPTTHRGPPALRVDVSATSHAATPVTSAGSEPG